MFASNEIITPLWSCVSFQPPKHFCFSSLTSALSRQRFFYCSSHMSALSHQSVFAIPVACLLLAIKEFFYCSSRVSSQPPKYLSFQSYAISPNRKEPHSS
ncbi:unnamed protein product [Larinioides sclopetarius]|uniref:Uncharacterized protein n=1 Tax=Larinioides sclopetarius TaxID=280406 RepID=A0AAV2ADM8_9ARAC